MLFDVESPVLLVSKVYKCEHGHDTPASYFHDTSEDYTCVPFVLTHRSGMTMRLADEIEDLLDRGLAISAVEELIKERYKRTLRNRLLRFLNDAHQAKELGKTPFTEAMNSLNAKWISCDHTFKAAANIGFERKEDSAWITQYTSLFCIINEKGQVIRWSFAMSESFDEVKPLLKLSR
ncbi:unnamed protein product [Porites lobata]|uniref:Uncharacterized protein n=1 Tax=Porites lobata TaxID=104759 RepID=A0ABN8NKZ6_9CNID|nr:unnamed protein product [Porites lobata]